MDEVSLTKSAWNKVSDEAKDFVSTLLCKDPAKRPAAKEALKHTWLKPKFHKDKVRALDTTVVQRIQRFGQVNLLRRTILELIANELIKANPPMLPDPTVQGGNEMDIDHDLTSEGSLSSGKMFSMSPEQDNSDYLDSRSAPSSNSLLAGAVSGHAQFHRWYVLEYVY